MKGLLEEIDQKRSSFECAMVYNPCIPDRQNDKMHSTLQNEPLPANFIGISVFMYTVRDLNFECHRWML